PEPPVAIRGYVFDAYGTLFDVHSVVEAGRAFTADPLALSVLWRQKQLEYTWLRSLMGRYEDFWAVTEAALRYSVKRLGLPASDVLFGSSNAWDVAGAKAFGYRVAWCNRLGAPEEELGLRADAVVTRLTELP